MVFLRRALLGEPEGTGATGVTAGMEDAAGRVGMARVAATSAHRRARRNTCLVRHGTRLQDQEPEWPAGPRVATAVSVVSVAPAARTGTTTSTARKCAATASTAPTVRRASPARRARTDVRDKDGTLNFFEFTEESWNEQLTGRGSTNSPRYRPSRGTREHHGHAFRGYRPCHPRCVHPRADDSRRREHLGDSADGITGRQKDIFVRRFDGVESNRLRVWVKPQLEAVTDPVVPGGQLTLRGLAFVVGASVLYDGAVVVADEVTRTTVKFTVPPVGTGVWPSEAPHSRCDPGRPDEQCADRLDPSHHRLGPEGRRARAGIPELRRGLTIVGHVRGHLWHVRGVARTARPDLGHPILTTAFYIF